MVSFGFVNLKLLLPTTDKIINSMNNRFFIYYKGIVNYFANLGTV